MGNKLLLVFTLIFLIEPIFTEPYLPKYLQGKYGNLNVDVNVPNLGIKTSFTKTKSPYSGGGSYNGGGNRGACPPQPPTPMNSGVRCSAYSGCKANCIPDYQFPNGQTELFIICENGQWIVKNNLFPTIPNCEPICLPSCQNNGICVGPNQCNCPENFSGPQCQYENKPCLNYPLMPLNAKRACRGNLCTITCMPGHQFPDGSAIAQMSCKNGMWVPDKEKWNILPNCQPTCSPACLNGGKCLSFNVCECPQDFRGPQCQYRADDCSPKRLQFNGGYKCNGNQESFSCALSCPEGVPFQFPPDKVYTCYYATGQFLPSPIPQCMYPDNVKVIPGQEHSNSYYVTNRTSHNTGSMSLAHEGQGSYSYKIKNQYDSAYPDRFFNNSNFEFVPIGQNGIGHGQFITVEQQLPKPGVCFTWGGSHYKTFDGKIFSFDSSCSHILVRDAVDNTFSVIVQTNKGCKDSTTCYKLVKVYLQDKEYLLKRSETGIPIFATKRKVLPIPAQIPGIRVEMSAHYIVLSLDSIGATVKWDGDKLVQIEVRENLWNRTEGLCGKLDGNIFNDGVARTGHIPKSIATLASSWKVDDLEDICKDLPTDDHACNDSGAEGTLSYQATEFCKNLIRDRRFLPCQGIVDIEPLLEACRWDYCSCQKTSRKECACETFNVYVRDCAHKGIKNLSTWRDEKTCPMTCTGGRIYKSCGPPSQQACGAVSELVEIPGECVEGCYCPDGMVLHENKCITRDKCPCRLRGKYFEAGTSVPKDCNTCNCNNGQWICTQISCGARCSAIGDPHYITFDGKKYDFMGQCSYYLVKTENFSIEAENVACAGSISEAMNFPISISSGLPSCTKTVTIRIAGQYIKLKQNHEVVVNGHSVNKIPYEIAGIKIRSVSSIFLQAELPNGVEVWWDGLTRAYIDVPPTLKGKTKGLCGTFNENQKDDFLTPEDDIEQSVVPFANKWKTSEKCNDVPESLSNHPCDRNVHHKATAEKHCGKLKSDLFKECHWFVDPEQFYQNCLYDMCACEFKISNCLCPTLSGYAEECSRKGIKIDWRSEVRECGIHCPGGQKYQVCGNSCTRTCSDISTRPDCRQTCVEGCNCPEGQTLDDNGECIPIGLCKCQHNGLDFQAGFKEVRPSAHGPELCTCLNGLWSCAPATPEEQKDFPEISDHRTKCNASLNFEFTTCESVEPMTCRNMHNYEAFSPEVCHAGCQCKKGFVLDTKAKRCVKPQECPCSHGGRSYKENAVVQSECNTCQCKNGKWKCTDRQCTAECSAWGDSHYKTFDGKHFDYQGQCDYVLAKGALGTSESFDVNIQSVPCGSLGTSCSKAVTIRVGFGSDHETITLTRDKPLPKYKEQKHLILREKGIFIIVEAPDIGLTVHWDKGTRVYIKVDPRWKSHIKGLCGNYNDNDDDDFQTPSGGLSEASAKIFGDSWRLQPYCPEALEITDTCEERPDRKVWALKKCGILKSQLFAPCHSEVPLENYFEKCVFDSCACDQGGDCECLCTALAAYAQECNNRGVPIKWRSQQLCPMQCDERCAKYSPCISTCQVETCDNLLTSPKLAKSCGEDSCIEGCQPKPCPEGFIYANSSFLDCVPRNVCKPVCLELEGTTYFEGDLIEEDNCHSCYCSRGQKICKGQPCTTTVIPTTQQMEQTIQCKSGWTEWINQNKHSHSKSKTKGKKKEIEPVPTNIILNNLKESAKCDAKQMVNIECRTVKSQMSAKETGLDAECSLEKGLVCKALKKGEFCPDFEIRVLCQCDDVPTEITNPTTVVTTEASMVCDRAQPHQEHESDCHLFYHCAAGVDGPELVQKSCGPDMMYNPQTMICDWPNTVIGIKPSCALETNQIFEPEPSDCPPGMVRDPCAIQCDNLCMYYQYTIVEQGLCNDGVKCESGCVSAEKKVSCPNGMFWANNETCVSMHDCMCISHNGKPVRPGQVYEEKDCKQCQCIDNFYTCHKVQCNANDETEMLFEGQHKKHHEHEFEYIERESSALESSAHKHVEIITQAPVFVVATVTPPEACDPKNFINLIQGDQPLSDQAFNASSTLSEAFAPSHARLDSKVTDDSGGSWAPEFSNEDQYLQIDLGRLEPVYGVIIRGSPLYDEYVTSFKVLYSPDGHTFYYVLNEIKHPEIFRGSKDNVTPVKQIFPVPFEAKLVRINPQTWNNGIGLRVELLGCGEPVTTEPPFEMITVQPTKPTQCDDSMGFSDGLMHSQQVTTSSDLNNEHNKLALRLSSDPAWQPLSNSPTEWVQFDFLETRNLTGVVTRGGKDGWVTSFAIKYSHDGISWNPVMSAGREKIFLGNIDVGTPQKTFFELPICARFLRLIPLSWKDNIQLRVEVQGCYKSYPEVEEIPLTTLAPSECNVCPGINSSILEMGACRCKDVLYWDGENCVNRTQCPCLVGHIPYAIGAIFEKEDCSECICKIGGVSHCKPKTCPSCKEGLMSTVTSTCSCTCKPCPENTVLCPTSNICINSTLWCNGVQDCPDDELDCPTTVTEGTTEPTIPTTTKKPKTCPIVECKPGYKREEWIPSKARRNEYLSPMITRNQQNTKSFFKGKYRGYSGKKGLNKGGYSRPKLQRPVEEPLNDIEEVICKEYRCVSNKPPPKYIHSKEECPPVVCQQNYIPVYDFYNINPKECPRYSCYPPPKPDAICNVTGRTFNTFDNTEYKYDICNHVLARDLDNDEWDISLKKECSKSCSRNLVIRHSEDQFVIYPDLSVEYDGYKYSLNQIKKLGSQSSTFAISQLGSTLLFVSNRYGFWIIWNRLGNVKLGVVHKLEEKVDGLCGFFNDMPQDDKRKPNGKLARTTVEFGDSWALASDQPVICEAKACPIHIQNQAWEICNKVKDTTLAPCAKVVDIEAFVSRCLETTCACLESATNHTAAEECRCQTMQNFVVDCLTADSSVDIADWRMQHDCPATCEAPLVYHDCYQRQCEPTCASISDPNVCPKTSNICFPGCYCPAGFVRKGETCIKPSSCRDCECNVLPHLQYVTYDESNFTVTGNCVYVMSRDVLLDNDKHVFQVLVTNHPCKNKPDKMCVGKVTILYEGHKIHILMDYYRNKLKLIVDGERIEDFSEVSDWMQVRETAAKHLKLLLINVQVETSVYFPSLGISVKAPSHKYGGKLEGLCGNCNGDAEDDIQTPKGEKTKDINEFATSWLYEHLPGGQSKEMCNNKPEEDCPPMPPDLDPCVQLVDINKFGQCMNIHDPSLFIEWCKKDTCGGHPERACTAIEAYARDCAIAGFCVNWRTEICPAQNCPAGQLYDPCGSNCPKTCDSLKSKKSCKEVPVEGCFCPEGKFKLNNTCVVEKDCEVCDDQGHHPGDKWKKDKCTTCTCDSSGVKCDTQTCTGADKICERGFQPIKLPSQPDECCDKYACIPEATAGPTCETPQKITCGTGQVLKLDTKPNGCQSFICECIPKEDCPKLNLNDTTLQPGYTKEIDESGCCPIVNLVCRKELCPKPEPCPQFYALKSEEIEGKCCPLHTCEPPKDKCIYETEYIASENGGERLQTIYEKQKLLKLANETWKDGPCRECKCLLTPIGNYNPVCSQTECPLTQQHSDFIDFELTAEPVFNECCPLIRRVACKHNGQVYKVGESWKKQYDPCTSFECIKTPDGNIQKETHIKSCDTNCDLGYAYVESSSDDECCGYCKPIACVVDNKIYKVGEEWISYDYCTNYFCLNVNGSMQVQSVKVNCPNLPEDYEKEFEYVTIPVQGECCKKHKVTGCKVNGKVYRIGETWPCPDGNKCKTISCVDKGNGELVKQESIESCNRNCSKGWEYVEDRDKCCGECKQIGCLVGDEVKKAGENWTSPDKCTTFSCDIMEDQYVVSSHQESCPSLEDCPEENIVIKGCCKHCNLTSAAQTLCVPESMALNETVGLIKVVHDSKSKGICVNKEAIKGFTECVGSCHSSTFFDIKSGSYESVCKCCQASKYENIEVELTCEDKSKWTKKVAVPSKCGCQGCAAQKKPSPTKTIKN